MADLADLQARRDALLRRRESLVTRVQMGERGVSYDLSQADAAFRELDRQIAEAQGIAPVRRFRTYLANRGW